MKKLVRYLSLSTLVLGINSAAFASTDTTDQHHKHYQDQSGTKSYLLISDDTNVPGSYDEPDSNTHSDSDESKDESKDADTTDQDNQNDADKPDDQSEDADSSSNTDDEPTQSDEEY